MIRGIRLRLALALLLVVAGALGVVYLIVVPSLEDRLVNAKLSQLEEDANTVAEGLQPEITGYQTYAERAASVVNTRVVIFIVIDSTPQLLAIYGDSNTSSSRTWSATRSRGGRRRAG